MTPRLPKGLHRPMRIGKGAFASVYRVRQETLDRWVAVKIITESDQLKREAILREGKTQAKLAMKHIPQIYDAFEWKKKIDIIMQWIPGVPLSLILQQNPSDEDRFTLAGALVRILADLHALGYAHRDLKPDNIIISPDDGMHFVDFAFAKNVQDGQVSMEGKVKGTPAYMAPELWRGERNTDFFRADLYSAGLILKEIQQQGRWQPLIDNLTSVHPEQRPASGQELLAQWENLMEVSTEPDWHKLAGDLSRESIAENLTAAAKELIQAKRYDEAYWLLVESLENNPDNAETLELISSVGQQPKKSFKRNTMLYAAAACILILMVLAAMYSERKTVTPDNSLTNGPVTKYKVAALPGQPNALVQRNIAQSLPFLTEPISHDELNGKLYLVNYPDHGMLVINGDTVVAPKNLIHGIALPGSRYSLSWLRPDSTILWRERVTLLPFQKKVINMPKSTTY